MTETGSTVERLRHQVEVGSRSIEWDEDFVEDSLPALLAVVEAAQEVDDLTESALYRARAIHPPGSKFHNLHMRLIALHTQASDEGGAGG